MKQYFILSLLFISTVNLSGQKPFQQKVWEKELDDISTKSIDAIGELSTGELVFLSNGNNENSSVTIMRRNGVVVKTVHFNQYKNAKLNALTITEENQILLVGSTTTTQKTLKKRNGCAVMMDARGEILWQKIYGGEEEDEFKSVIAVNASSFLLVGNTKSGWNSKGNAWAVLINEKGEQNWSYDYGRDSEVTINVGLRAGNTFILGGCRKFKNNEKGFLIGINGLGKELWTIELSDKTNILAGTKTFDDEAVFTGYTLNHSKKDVLALKIKADLGNVLWSKTYENKAGDDYGQAVLEMLNGKLLLLGHSHLGRFSLPRSKIWYLEVNSIEGKASRKIGFWGDKKENTIKSVYLSSNKDVLLGGIFNQSPYIGRFKTALMSQPTITWNDISTGYYKRVFKEEKGSFLNVSATVLSPILLNQDDFKIYLNREIANNEKYYENLTISKPSVSTSKNGLFLYTVKNRIPVQEIDSAIEMRLYNSLYSVHSTPLNFKLVTPFRLDILWIEPNEANSNGLTDTVRNNNMTFKMVIISSEELSKDDFHIVINGEKVEAAKDGETVIKPFIRKKDKQALVKRYNYINNIILQKGKNEIKLAIDINGEVHYSTPVIRYYQLD